MSAVRPVFQLLFPIVMLLAVFLPTKIPMTRRRISAKDDAGRRSPERDAIRREKAHRHPPSLWGSARESPKLQAFALFC
jgi:hypothetical protein